MQGVNKEKTMLKKWLKDEKGQDLVEYALLSALISTIAIAVLESLGISLNIMYINIREAFLIHY